MKKFSIARNVIWNLLGTGLPLVVSLFTIPQLIVGFGPVKFGLLTLIWAIIGYFSIFDFGLGRALTKLVAERINSKLEWEIKHIVYTSILVIIGLGVVAGIIVFCFSTSLVVDILNIKGGLKAEAIGAVRILSFSLPLVVLQAAVVGLLEAHKAFKQISLVRLFLGLSNFITPLIVLKWSSDLQIATYYLAIARVLSSGLYIWTCFELKTLTLINVKFDLKYVSMLFRFGAWITISNIISPLMVQLDKFIIGTILSLSTLAFYTVPADMVNRFAIAPVALVSIVFPLFSNLWATDRIRIPKFYKLSCQLMLVSIFPVSAIAIMFANEGLTLWLGNTFAHQSTFIIQLLVIGFFTNSAARIPHALLQSIGKPSITAKLHIIELPIYIILLYVLLNNYGIVGAAIASGIRMLIDLSLLLYMGGREIKLGKWTIITYLLLFLFASCLLVFPIFISGMATKLIISLIIILLFGYLFKNKLSQFQLLYKLSYKNI